MRLCLAHNVLNGQENKDLKLGLLLDLKIYCGYLVGVAALRSFSKNYQVEHQPGAQTLNYGKSAHMDL